MCWCVSLSATLPFGGAAVEKAGGVGADRWRESGGFKLRERAKKNRERVSQKGGMKLRYLHE